MKPWNCPRLSASFLQSGGQERDTAPDQAEQPARRLGDVGRLGEAMTATTLGEVRPEQVDMRTVVIVGSSLTRSFPRAEGGAWVYTPR